ncbi:hypothetical protein L3X38_025512 [Prunus dulcis]|uniref:Retrotransposon gag domain-containing protein n=1 Tax=Prunus dulcis TaxID=3755 RepID=A0AAD4Z7H7_PRUDU|nr:hypothetical protein L3X38_025512 [Prunus dulcis]
MIQDMVPHARRIGRPVYRRPYPEHFDQEEFLRGFKVSDFALFSGDGLQSTVEHIGRFTAQCMEIGHREALKLRLFSSTLMGADFSWYVKLPQNSVPNWQVIEQVFQEQFYRPEPKVSMADLAKISQKTTEWDSTKPSGSRTTVVHAVDIEDIDSEERGDEVYLEEEESAGVKLAEIMAKGLYVCKALSKASKDQRLTTARMSKFSGTSQKAAITKSNTFDISKAEQIFNQLLKEKIIKLSNDHDVPSANEIRNKTYCKFHNVWSHTTNNCLVFRNALQDLIDRKILKFPEKATMGVDQNPFPNAQVNMVNANFPRPDQPRPRLDLGGSVKAAAERRAREIPGDPKAKGKAKMYPKVTKVLETKVTAKEEPPKAIVLCSRCQCEVTLEVVPPKPKESTKEPTKGLIKEQTKDQVQVGRSRSFERNMVTSPAENYGPHSPKGGMEVRPNKRPLHEYQDRYERPRYQPKKRNKHAPSKADKRQAQLDRLVELREKLRLEELELAKADAVALLEAAAAEEMKICRE